MVTIVIITNIELICGVELDMDINVFMVFSYTVIEPLKKSDVLLVKLSLVVDTVKS